MSINNKAPEWYRIAALRRFAVSITLLNVLGHTLLGFEQSWAQPLVSLIAAYSMEILLEIVDATTNRRAAKFKGGLSRLIDFLLPAHIAGLAVAMLLYANELLLPVAFASATAIASKTIFCMATRFGTKHFLNPSNFGITLTLWLFPFVGISAPYHFTENLGVVGDWALPGLIVVSGSLLHATLGKRLPLVAAWLIAYMAQALVRNLIFETSLVAALVPMTGVAFILFTFYMIPDPATTPVRPAHQMAFGTAVAFVYGALVTCHVVFGLFFALTFVCAGRGLFLYVHAWLLKRATEQLTMDAPVFIGKRSQ